MSPEPLTQTIKAAMKAAMKAKDKERLATIRLIQAEFKRIEVDERIEVDDARALAVLDKMVKQRRESISQYEKGGRPELAAAEAAEIEVLQVYLPEPLDEAALAEIIDNAISETGAESMRDMGKVMGKVKAAAAGRADMAQVSAIIKARLAG